uniref:Uncharacterized protein ycf35 n=1 Tax=Bornetia secundiflora TaxID=2575637 RepID=A0A4D6WMU3_9FLOR|nr:hypothetical protein [Bornetia secundiflora]
MSHFSKIKTNISDLELLKKTIIDLGFTYKVAIADQVNAKVYLYNSFNQDTYLCSFQWNDYQYFLVTDMQLWNFQFNDFLEKLNQKYAYNVIMQKSMNNGFDKICQEVMNDGSVKLVMQRWCYN